MKKAARAIFETYLKAQILGTPLEHYEEVLYEAVVAHINIHLESVSNQHIPHGISRILGSPDLPDKFDWPFCQGEPLRFIAQFNLEEVAPYDTFEKLPPTGMLSFFHYELGELHNDLDAWRVCLHPLEALVRRSSPHRLNQNEKSFRTSFETVYEFIYNELIIQSGEEEFLRLARHSGGGKSTHLLGIASDISSCDRDGILLEIDMEDLGYPIDRYFGTAVFGIDSSDLQEQRFDKVWTEVTRD